jgi:hypothetical protein
MFAFAECLRRRYDVAHRLTRLRSAQSAPGSGSAGSVHVLDYLSRRKGSAMARRCDRRSLIGIAAWLVVLGMELQGWAEGECESFGTRVSWNRNLQAAAVQAEREDKLLLVLHLSGNFAKNEFT